MNADGTQLRDPTNSGLTRWRVTVIKEKYVDAAVELGRNPVCKQHTQPEHEEEQADAERDG